MLQPGLSRAVPMGFVGFFTGALLVFILRGLQGLTPLWDPGVGLIVCAFMVAGFFIWGIGAFNPKLSVHGDEAEEEAVHHELEVAANRPSSILTSSVWRIAFILLIATIILFAFAALPFGPTLTITQDPLASTTQIGNFTLTIGDQVIEVSELVVFLLFIGLIFVSLLIFAGLLGALFVYLNRNIKQVETDARAPRPAAAVALGSGNAAVAALPSGAGAPAYTAPTEPFPDIRVRQLVPPRPVGRNLLAWLVWLVRIPLNAIYLLIAPPATNRTAGGWVRTLLVFAIVFIILYLLFYYVAIGLILPGSPLLVPLSVINALLITFLILRPKYVLQLTGYIALVIARFVRWLPRLLFQRG